MGNLMPTDVNEAKRMIASLSRFNDEEVSDFCSIVQRYKEI